MPRPLRVVIACLAGTMALAPGASAETTAPSAVKGFKFDATGFVILPGDTAPSAAPRDVRDGEEVLRATVGLEHVGALERAITFDLFGKPVTIDASALLTVGKATGGDLARFPADPIIMCRDPDNHFVKQLAAATTLLLSTLFTRFSTWTQVCLADTDRDGAVDHAFMIGTKQAADRRLFPIAPVRYRLARNVPLTDSRLILRYEDPALFAGPRLEASLILGGETAPIQKLRFGTDRKWVGTTYKIKDDKLPQTIDLAGASIVAERLTDDKKVLSVRVLRDVTPGPLDYELRPNIITVYY